MTLRALCASWHCRCSCRCTHTKGSTSWLCLLFSAAWDHAVATYTAACKQVLAEREDMDDDDAEAATPGGAGAGAGATAGAGTSDAAASPSFGAQCAVLFHLYWRIGRETGSMQRAMQDAGLSWGYFLDHVPEPHNNAHPGNFVVLPPVRACVRACVFVVCDGVCRCAYRADWVCSPGRAECGWHGPAARPSGSGLGLHPRHVLRQQLLSTGCAR